MNTPFSTCLRLLIFLIATVKSLAALADVRGIDTISLAEHADAYLDALKPVDGNPALEVRRYATSLSRIAATAENHRAVRPFFHQLGQGQKTLLFTADSHLRLSANTAVWGLAEYAAGERRRVKWNSTADFLLLYPYVMADTLGGDLTFERYAFKAGWASAWKKIKIGAEARFRAEHEYRTTDPRPRNIVTDLTLLFGASAPLLASHELGLTGGLRFYKQTNNVAFLREAGVIPEYHMLGLGMDYKRFSGNNASAYYKATGCEVGIDLVPTGKSGLMLSTQYAYTPYHRILPNLNALRVAGLDSTWRAVAPEYMKGMAWADYAKKGNWMFTSVYRNRNNEFYPYFLNNKQAFLANNELLQVNNKFESMLTPALLSYACGDVAYDKADVESYRRDLHTFNMPDSCACLVLCDIADLRGQGRIADLISYMKTSGRYLDKYYGIRANIEQTFKFPNATAEEKKALLAYLQEAVKREEGTKVGMRLRSFVESLANAGKGITFATGTVADILAKAKAEGKMVFLDCYTTWCGPCRMMANTIFTKNEVGEYFNKHFVSYKLDMERGEGPALGKKYGVKAFPTMLFMDAEGNVRHTIVGSKSANELIEEAKAALKK